MSYEEEKRWVRYQIVLKMVEPFEMTYWKKRLNAPHKRIAGYIQNLFSICFGSFAIAK